jgi:hypothetical protein
MKIRNRYLFVLVAVWGPGLILAGAFYLMLLRPRAQYGQELQTRVAAMKARYARAFEAAQKENQARLAEQVDGLRRRVSDFVVGRHEAPDLAFAISELAGQMQLGSFGMRPVSKGEPEASRATSRLGEKRIDVSFSAGFPQFAAFLNALERHRPILFVETFAIDRPVDASAAPRVNMELAALVEKLPGE